MQKTTSIGFGDYHGKAKPLPIPVLRLIVLGVGTTIRAAVVYSIPGDARQYRFISGGHAGSAQNALHILFVMTMELLNEVYDKDFYHSTKDKWVNTQGVAGYFTSGV